MTISNEELTKLVDWEHGLISPEIFISEEIYQKELEQLFGRSWLFLAHDSMFPNPGDFFSTYMGGDPVIIARQKDGSVKAFLNVCRHRGMKVCRAEEGNANAFMCTYHGWTYDGSGALVSVPNFEDVYYGELEMSKWGLVPVRVESYKGLWFGNFDESAPSLIDYLGDMTWFMDAWLDATDEGIEFIPGVVKWTIKGNWKLAAEQFAGDGYHARTTHLSSLGQFFTKEERPGRQFASRLGHGEAFGTPRGNPIRNRFGLNALQDHRDRVNEEATARLGAEQAAARGHFTVFPTLSGSANTNTLRVWHPKGPNKFEIWAWTMIDKSASEDVKRLQQVGSVHMEGAAGMVEIDDGENWDLMGEVLEHGLQSRRIAWHYAMGLGHEHDDDAHYPGRIAGRQLGETPQRGFYRRWLEMMTSESWPYVDSLEPTAPLRERSR
jgi:3-phenylpropionate/trans-cinnamate dioxygenase alpha subunit